MKNIFIVLLQLLLLDMEINNRAAYTVSSSIIHNTTVIIIEKNMIRTELALLQKKIIFD